MEEGGVSDQRRASAIIGTIFTDVPKFSPIGRNFSHQKPSPTRLARELSSAAIRASANVTPFGAAEKADDE